MGFLGGFDILVSSKYGAAMSGALIQQVIDLKRDLRKQEHDLDTKAMEIYEREPWVKDPTRDPLDLIPEEVETKRRFLEFEGQQLAVKLELNRAQLFGLRHTKGTERPCIVCFVKHGEPLEMVEVAPKILGTKLFRCAHCGHELKEG